ncbi:MAG: thiol oxidoreductase [Bryobacterales bacterium]|nr:thiol oxidoreductase [Bryobacterales bacterium]
MKAIALSILFPLAAVAAAQDLGKEVAIPKHLADGDEFQRPLSEVIDFGNRLFSAMWTGQEGAGRPLTKGNGKALADASMPLTGERMFNRISAPDANSCAGCHNLPYGIPGGGGDFVANVFVLAQRFDFVTFNSSDPVNTGGGRDEQGRAVTQQSIGNSRATTGMFGAGFLEMLARQITADLRAQRDAVAPGQSAELRSKGISFGAIARFADGSWETTGVAGLPPLSLQTTGPADPPPLIIRPWHQAGAVVSLREFTNNAFNHHHGIQSAERFGRDQDPDGDGFKNELTRADITAASLAQAVMAVPGRVIPNDPVIEAAVLEGEKLFTAAGCASCHTPTLRLDRLGWIYTEPNPFNPAGNLRPGEADTLSVDLTSRALPQPRLPFALGGVIEVPAYTDFKLHDLCDGPDDPNVEPLDMQQAAGTPGFFAGNRLFLTRRLWDSANQPPYFHHGRFTTMRQAILAHGGEGAASRSAYLALPSAGQDAVIEFLKTLQVLPPGTKDRIVDEKFRAKEWPPVGY